VAREPRKKGWDVMVSSSGEKHCMRPASPKPLVFKASARRRVPGCAARAADRDAHVANVVPAGPALWR
jgi:hypothetical protein